MTLNIFISSLLDDFKALQLIIKDLKQSLEKENDSILFIPSSPEYYEGSYEWQDEFVQQLSFYGIDFKQVLSLEDHHSIETWQASVNNASLIYLHGGNPLIQQSYYQEKQIYEILRRYDGVLLGASAGAMNMANTITLTPTNEEYTQYINQPALSKIEESIFPHLNINSAIYRYYSTGDGPVDLNDLLTLAPDQKIILLADGQFVIVNNQSYRITPHPIIYTHKGSLFYNHQPVYLGWKDVQSASHLVSPTQFNTSVQYFEDWQEAKSEGRLNKMFKHSFDFSKIKVEGLMKFYAIEKESVVIKQLANEYKVIYLISHPHLLSGSIVYEETTEGLVEETFIYRTVFTKKIEKLIEFKI